jgi:O-antigen ligase/Tfp pilus assembly protein PilF
MSQKIYYKILQWGIYASFLVFPLINNNWLYPYNTPKQIFFNILIEALAVVWLALIIRYPEARPKKSWLTWSFLAWLGVLLITSLTGVDFNLSFWGDANRMMGWFHLAHWFVFYVILITVFKTKADWQKLFNLSLITAGLMTVYSLVKSPETGFDPGTTVNMSNNISTLGHATHVAGVMMFCFFLALFGYLNSKERNKKIVYTLAGVLALVGFGYANVSGSQAGLAVGLVIFGLLYAFLAGSKKTKKISLISVGAFITIIAVLYGLRQVPFMQNSFGKLFRDFSTQNTNLNTRMYAWRAGWEGFKEKPALGWGYGDFGVVYDKFFKGNYYRYTMDEEYFDRAHNNLIDLGATTGIIGLLFYLSIFVAIGYYLVAGFRQHKFGWLEFSIATAIITAYFIHNLAVFDFWGTYFMFFMVLAWIFSLYQGQADSALGAKGNLTNKEILTWLLAGIVGLFLIFNYNVAFAKSFIGTIKLTDILRTTPQSQELLDYYQEPFKNNTPMDRSGIELVLDFVDGQPELLANLSKEDRQTFFDYLINLNKKIVALNPDNSLTQARLGRTLMTACMNLEDKSYCQASLEPLNKSMETGGDHIPPYRVKSTVQLYLNDVDGAIATLNQALKIYPDYTQVNCQLARIYVQLKTSTEADRLLGKDYMKKCVASGGGQDFAQSEGVLAQSYKEAEEAIKTDTEQKKLSATNDEYLALLKEGLRLKGEGDMGNRDAYYKAIEIFKKATALSDSKTWIPFLNIGNLYKILGDYEQADVNYNQALQISGGDVIPYLAKIELYQLYIKKPPAEIMDLYQKALKTVTDNGNLMIGYANFCRDNGYLEDALKAFKSLSESFPDNKTYLEEIAKLKAQLKK